MCTYTAYTVVCRYSEPWCAHTLEAFDLHCGHFLSLVKGSSVSLVWYYVSFPGFAATPVAYAVVFLKVTYYNPGLKMTGSAKSGSLIRRS